MIYKFYRNDINTAQMGVGHRPSYQLNAEHSRFVLCTNVRGVDLTHG